MNPELGEFPEFETLQEAIDAFRLGLSASELHGLTAGFIALGGRFPLGHWIEAVLPEIDADGIEGDPVLGNFPGLVQQQLEDGDFGFDLLLPSEASDSTEIRARALLDWCQGFLSGGGLVVDAPTLEGDALEALETIGQIAAFPLEEGESDEDSLIEIIEFVRIAVLTVHVESRLLRRREKRRKNGPSLH